MTRDEFSLITMRIRNLWHMEFDKSQADAWHQVIGGLNPKRLLRALDWLALECKFPPRIAEIVGKYEEIKLLDALEARKKEIASHSRLLTAEGQHNCHICLNSGTVSYWTDINRSGRHLVFSQDFQYEHTARCSCARGKDLNRWSRHQITKGMMWSNPATKEDESLYMPDVNDVLTNEEIGLLQAKNMSRSAAISEKLDIGAMMQKMVEGMNVGRATV